ncbi:MAG: sulfotransferase family 2 domain-containing protein [Sulfitobacter sp.]
MTGIVYIHVPKCGGSSFGAALRLRFALSQATITLGQGDPALPAPARILDDYAKRQIQLQRLMARRVRMISGHVQYCPLLHDQMRGQYAYVTLLRDPVERFVSHYNYLQRRHPDPARAPDLHSFLDTSDAARLAAQYLFYFAGPDQTHGGDTAARRAQAIRNLARFDLVGDLSDTPGFAQHLRQLTRLPLPQWRRNAAPKTAPLAEDLRARITALCAADIAIYQSAQLPRAAA